MHIVLDCLQMKDRKTTHAYLKENLEFPDYYGNNLDALFDLLSAEGRELTIEITNAEALEANLGGYGTALLATIREAAEDNPNVKIKETSAL